jgi:hypothetical protein
MHFMVMVRANEDTESGRLPTTEEFTAMLKFNEELVKAGVMLGGEGLQPSSKGAARILFEGDKRTVVDGPFAESKELIAGFWILQAKSKDEVVEWMKRCPNPTRGKSVLEIRQIFQADDFGEAFTPELREQEKRLGETAARQQAKG